MLNFIGITLLIFVSVYFLDLFYITLKEAQKEINDTATVPFKKLENIEDLKEDTSWI